MNNFTERYLDAAGVLNKLVEDVKPLKERFYKFIDTHQPYSYLEFNLEAAGEKPSVEDYELDVWKLGKDSGMRFFIECFDYDYSADAYFVIPDGFLADPAAFENNLLNKIKQEWENARNIVDGVFGIGTAASASLSVNSYDADPSRSDDKRFLIIDIANAGRKFGMTEQHKYLLAHKFSYAWDSQTGFLYYGGWSTADNIVREKEVAEPLGQVIL